MALAGPGDLDEAEACLNQALGLRPSADLAERLKQTHSRLARQVLRANASDGPRMDVVMVCTSALEVYGALDAAGQKQLLMEVATAGQKGWQDKIREMLAVLISKNWAQGFIKQVIATTCYPLKAFPVFIFVPLILAEGIRIQREQGCISICVFIHSKVKGCQGAGRPVQQPGWHSVVLLQEV